MGTVNDMMAVRCPACNERVEGRSSEDLSRSIKSHFTDIHKMDIDVEMRTSDEGCGCGDESGVSKGSSSSEATMGPSSSGQREEFAEGADRMRVGQKQGPGTMNQGTEVAPGSKGEQLETFDCPMCREEVSGSSEEDISSAFREHLATTHKDEPFVTRLMEKVGGRR